MTGNAKVVASVTGEKNNLQGWLLLDSLKYSPAIITPGTTQKRFAGIDDRNADTNMVLNENMLTKESLHTYIRIQETRKYYSRKSINYPTQLHQVEIKYNCDPTCNEPESPRARSREDISWVHLI